MYFKIYNAICPTIIEKTVWIAVELKKFNFSIPIPIPIRSKKINELQFELQFQFIESNSMNGLKNWTNYSSLKRFEKEFVRKRGEKK